ncbi:UNVERIFIED_CONTAM: hypothetical protein FKN15_077307 [Acipenser sinensis]
MLRDSVKSWSNGQSDSYNSDQEEEEEEEEMVFGENDGDLEEMMDLSDLPTSLFACSVHEAAFEDEQHRQVSHTVVQTADLIGNRRLNCFGSLVLHEEQSQKR